MKFFAALFILSLLPTFSPAQALRLSKVVDAEGPDITRFEMEGGPAPQIIFVEDKAFITEDDIAKASPSKLQPDSVDITLSKAGEKKMREATLKMRGGIDRIAIIVDGKILSAPVIQSVPLGKNFIISGLNARNGQEASELAARLSGKKVEADE